MIYVNESFSDWGCSAQNNNEFVAERMSSIVPLPPPGNEKWKCECEFGDVGKSKEFPLPSSKEASTIAGTDQNPEVTTKSGSGTVLSFFAPENFFVWPLIFGPFFMLPIF
ncbi:hypothetical protein niasHS_001927 [Heterodera schachtii]|uniref:Uncharacterized protein n=1 Tax=Heterodera schachtii TaxID=97005 RepID=A0ABD2KAV2_HETSC